MHPSLRNNYKVVEKDNADNILVPFKLKDGTQPPNIYLKHINKQYVVTIDNYKESVWHENIIIDNTGSPQDYIKLVHWWFDNATEYYWNKVKDEFKNLEDIDETVDEFKERLCNTRMQQ